MGARKGTAWQEHELQYVKENYQFMTPTEIGRVLNRTQQSVASKVKLMKEDARIQINQTFHKIAIGL